MEEKYFNRNIKQNAAASFSHARGPKPRLDGEGRQGAAAAQLHLVAPEAKYTLRDRNQEAPEERVPAAQSANNSNF